MEPPVTEWATHGAGGGCQHAHSLYAREPLLRCPPRSSLTARCLPRQCAACLAGQASLLLADRLCRHHDPQGVPRRPAERPWAGGPQAQAIWQERPRPRPAEPPGGKGPCPEGRRAEDSRPSRRAQDLHSSGVQAVERLHLCRLQSAARAGKRAGLKEHAGLCTLSYLHAPGASLRSSCLHYDLRAMHVENGVQSGRRGQESRSSK